ncbi:hypothetical protein NKH77_07380 [Streptomyces sp. M19]
MAAAPAVRRCPAPRPAAAAAPRPLRVPALRAALRAGRTARVAAHPVPAAGRRPRQVIEPAGRVPVPFVDLGGPPADDDRRALLELRRAALSGYVLDRRPPCRFALARFGPDDHVLVMSIPTSRPTSGRSRCCSRT